LFNYKRDNVMARKIAPTKKEKGPGKGAPSGRGVTVGLREPLDLDNLEEHNRLSDKYTDGPDEISANVPVSHPNRNTNKPDIDKPPYS
jgi:hypothetical protein